MKIGREILLAIIAGALAGALVSAAFFFAAEQARDSPSQRITDFYLTENEVLVSPHSLRGKMDKGAQDFVLVDLRSAEEYGIEHVRGAVNIPAYSDKFTSAYGDTERIVEAFANLSTQNQGKAIIVYCYSTPCMTGRKIGLMLAQHGIYAKHLGIGWNEWRYYWNLWNHEHEWNSTKVEDYLWKGSEPGTPKAQNASKACPASGPYGC